MRTHSQIIREATVAKVMTILAEAGLPVSEPTVRSWLRRPDKQGSIPDAYWMALSKSGVAALEELASRAEQSARDRLSEAA